MKLIFLQSVLFNEMINICHFLKLRKCQEFLFDRQEIFGVKNTISRLSYDKTTFWEISALSMVHFSIPFSRSNENYEYLTTDYLKKVFLL